MMRISKIGLLILLVIGGLNQYKGYAQQNILLIIADDLGIDYAPGYPSVIEKPPTPTLDNLISEGLTFSNVWSNPLCSPTRATILTGKYGFRTGVGAPVGGKSKPGISLDEYCLPQAIEDLSGQYQTACFGKWHLSSNSNGNADNPNLVGFNHYSGSLGGGLPDYYSWEKVTNGVAEQVENYATTETVDDAIEWISEKDSSWFVWLSFNAVHTPMHKPPNSLHSYDYLNETIGQNDDLVPYFMAMNEAMDTEVGRLFTYLKSIGEYENTNIIFLGDNGTPSEVVQSPYGKRKAKGSLYEGGVHVPFYMSGPAVNSVNQTTDALISTVDIFNTILHLAGVETEGSTVEETDSKSLENILNNTSNSHREWLYSEAFNNDRNNGKTARNENYHLFIEEDGTEAFFYLPTDIYESQNLLNSELATEELENYTYLKAKIDSLTSTTTSPELIKENEETISIIKTNNRLTLQIPESMLPGKVIITDMMGRRLYQSKASQNSMELPSVLSRNNCLIITCKNADKIISEKFIFQ